MIKLHPRNHILLTFDGFNYVNVCQTTDFSGTRGVRTTVGHGIEQCHECTTHVDEARFAMKQFLLSWTS